LGVYSHPGKLTGAKRREWMGMGVAGMIITSDDGSFLIPYSAPVSLVITLIFCCQPNIMVILWFMVDIK